LRRPSTPLAIAYAAGWAHGGIDRDAFFHWMERSVQHRDFWLVMLRADPGRVGVPDRLEV
jgi:hypothetical protein